MVEWLSRSATVVPDPQPAPPVRFPDPDDDYLLALALAERAILVSGDDHLLSLAVEYPVRALRDHLAVVDD